jgi:hypothetical protein
MYMAVFIHFNTNEILYPIKNTLKNDKLTFVSLIYSYVNHSGHVTECVDLHPLDFWDHSFESRCRYGCSSLVFVVCCVGSGPCNDLTTHSNECY